MKKLIVSLMVGLVSIGMLVAQDIKVDPAQAAYAAARVLLQEGGWSNSAPAQAAYEKVITDYPDASVNILANSQTYIGISLVRQRKYSEAQAAFEKAINDYPNASVNVLANAQLRVGSSLNSQGKLVEAQAAFEKLIDDYPNASVSILANAQHRVGNSLNSQGKLVEAQAAYMACVQNYIWNLNAPNEKSLMWRAFDQVNPTLVSSEVYKAFLENTLKATKATEENARFLGRVKSELEKIK